MPFVSVPDKPWFRVLDFYEPVDPEDGWLKSTCCDELPWVWLFNNGRFAQCPCCNPYKEEDVRAESIMSVQSRTGNTKAYERFELRDKWNHFVETGEKQSELPKGQW